MHLMVIAGPTASGKTTLATKLAYHWNADIISADSRQVYRGLDLGTGKDLEEFQKYDSPIRYHLIDIINPNEVYSLYQFQQEVYGLLKTLSHSGPGRRDLAIMVGGTGMYIESVLRRYRIANVPENPEVRMALEGCSREELELDLRTKNPALAARTDLSSKKRIIRAFEILESGLSDEVAYSPLPELDFSATVFAIHLDRQELRQRINLRLQTRLQAGMIEEVSNLIKQGISPARLRLLGMEYREITDYVMGVKEYSAMVADLQHEIHMLAKRQETYFRGMERRGTPVHWIRQEEGIERIRAVLISEGIKLD
jgi:tRNA dimethylallyltransferase